MGLDKEEEKFAVCKYCEERVSWGGTSVKNYNTTNLRNHLWHFTRKLFDELVTKSVMMQRRNRTRKKKPMGKREKTRRSTPTYLCGA